MNLNTKYPLGAVHILCSASIKARDCNAVNMRFLTYETEEMLKITQVRKSSKMGPYSAFYSTGLIFPIVKLLTSKSAKR